MLKYIILFSIIFFYHSMPSTQLDKNANHIIFIQQTPVTALRVLKRDLQNARWTDDQIDAFLTRKAMALKPQKWIIFGLVSLNSTGHFLTHCANSTGQPRKYGDSVPSETFREELIAYWPTYLSIQKEDTWNTHYNVYGSCINYTPLEYFQNAIKLYGTYNLKEILENHGIVPGGKYSYLHITGNITNALKVVPYVTCKSFKESQDQYLSEVHVCLNSAYQLNNCQHLGVKNCNPDIDIVYATWQDL